MGGGGKKEGERKPQTPECRRRGAALHHRLSAGPWPLEGGCRADLARLLAVTVRRGSSVLRGDVRAARTRAGRGGGLTNAAPVGGPRPGAAEPAVEGPGGVGADAVGAGLGLPALVDVCSVGGRKTRLML